MQPHAQPHLLVVALYVVLSRRQAPPAPLSQMCRYPLCVPALSQPCCVGADVGLAEGEVVGLVCQAQTNGQYSATRMSFRLSIANTGQGRTVGDVVGESVGDAEGEAEGDTVGETEGEMVGEAVGEPVGLVVSLHVWPL